MTSHDALSDSLDLQEALHILQTTDPSSRLFKRCREVLDSSLEVQPPIPKATPRGERKFLTIGMAVYDDYDGFYFTIQAIRLYHPEILSDVEFLAIDNNPMGPGAKALKNLENWAPNFRYLPYRSRQGTAVRDLIFRESASDFVLCIDSHVFFPPGTLARLIEYCRRRPDTLDLLHGPLIGDDFKPMATCLEEVWVNAQYGTWCLDERGSDIDSPPFEIPMHGLGVFACRRDSWPGFNPRLAGYGAEEGYIHEKIRRAGGRNLCLPFLRWMHRYARPMGISYTTGPGFLIRNYLLVYDELEIDPTPVIDHYMKLIGEAETRAFVRSAQAELASPFHFFDAIYCINLDREVDRWVAMQQRFRALSIDRGIRRFSAADTPSDGQIGYTLSHRRVVAEAKQQQLQTVLVLDDDVVFTPDAAVVLQLALQELQGREWQLLSLGGHRSRCEPLSSPDPSPNPSTHAIAYHHTVYDAILNAVPDNATDVALWLRTHSALDSFYATALQSSFTIPAVATK